MDVIVTVVSEVFGVDRKDVAARQAGRRERNKYAIRGQGNFSTVSIKLITVKLP